MKIEVYFVVSIFLLGVMGCTKDDGDLPSDQQSSCPVTRAPSENLPLSPVPETSRPVHVHGKNTTWTWQLKGNVNTSYSVDLYDIDLFDNTSEQIAALKASGKKVICYFSAGSSENWRSDFANFATEDLGSNLDDWDGERWLDIRSSNVVAIMKARIDLAVTKGCDGVEPDNMDGYQNDQCFNLSSNDQIAYNRAIANYARQRGLSVGLKNDPEQVADLNSYFDFSVVEQCYYYGECDRYAEFTASDKPIFVAEYDNSYRLDPGRASVCTYAQSKNLQLIIFGIELDDSFRFACS